MAAEKIYIAGRITGDPGYPQKFARASVALRRHWPEAVILNPAALPAGMAPADYMAICLPMLLRCGIAVFLPDWQRSNGARIERALAAYCGKQIIDLEDLRDARG